MEGKKGMAPGRNPQQMLLTPIASLTPNLKNVNVQFIVLEMGAAKRTKDGHDVRTIKVADHSGSIDMGVWDEVGEAIRPSYICRLRNGFVSVRNGALTLSIGKMGDINKIGEITMVYSELPNMSVFNPELVGGGGAEAGGQAGARKPGPESGDRGANEPAPPAHPAPNPPPPSANLKSRQANLGQRHQKAF